MLVGQETHKNFYFNLNNVFDPNKALKIRMRQTSVNEYIFTIKVSISNEDSVFVNQEYITYISKEKFTAILENGLSINDELLQSVACYLKKSFDETLIISGVMETERIFYMIDNLIEPINIDISYYLGSCDYEIEWETNSIEIAKNYLKELITNANIIPLNNHLSKTGRFNKKYMELFSDQLNP